MFTRRAFTGAIVAAATGVKAAFAATQASVVLPMHYDYGVLWTSVLIEGKGPYRFIVHTGQTYFNISRKLAAALALRRKSTPDLDFYTPAGKVDAEVYTATEFVLGSAYRINKVDLIARTYGTEETFPGTIPFFPNMPTSFDFSKNEMTFHPGGFTPPPGALRLRLIPPPEDAYSTTPVVQAELDGRPIKLAVNTGCYSPLILYPAAVRRLRLWDYYPSRVSCVDEDDETGDSEVRTVRASIFKIADTEFTAPVVVLENPAHAAPGASLVADGSIGLDLLRRFFIAFDHRGSAAWFTTRPELLNEPFAYDRSGFDSRTVEGDLHKVISVRPGGPAEKAGLQVGDTLALSPDAMVHLNYALTKPAGTKIAFDVQRGGTIMPVHLTLEELI